MKVLNFDGTIYEARAGSASQPGISFAGDPNTGIYSPGADQLAISTNGTGRLFVDASGNVGIGTSNVGDQLDIAAGNYRGITVKCGTTAHRPTLSFFNTADSLAAYIQASGNSLQFGAMGTDYGGHTPRMTLSSTGLGIGTSSPSANLDARGTVALSQMLNVDGNAGTPITAGWAATGAGGKLMTLSNTAAGGSIGNGNTLYLANYSNDNGTYARAFNVTTSGADKFWVGSNGAGYFAGSVGIGATSVTNLLHLRSDSSSNVDHLYLQNRNGGVNSGARIAFSNGTVDYGDNRYAYIGAVNTGATESGNHLVFATNANGASATEKARIDSSGRLLVGISSARSNFFNSSSYSPALQLEGANDQGRLLSIVGSNSGGAGGVLILASQKSGGAGGNTPVTDGGQLGLVSFQGSDGTEFVEAARIQVEVDGTPGANDMPGRLVFSTTADGASSPTERIRIKSDGVTSFGQGATGPGSGVAGTLINAGDGGILITNNTDPFLRCYTLNGGFPNALQIASNGNVTNANNSYGAISDIKLKENIVDANSQWSDIKALQVRNYNLKEGQTHTQIGLIAQEVEQVSPGLVSESPDRDTEGNDLGTVTKSVNYSVLYMKAVKALQEAMERIEQLEVRLTAAGID